MAKLAMFHTSVATLDTMKDLLKQYMPGTEVVHLIEESMIQDVMQSAGITAAISRRIMGYVQIAENAGCSDFITACSSIGYAVEQCQPFTSMTLHRIDTAMLETALTKGSRIAVLATVQTTLEPTVSYLQRLAARHAKNISVDTYMQPEAFQALLRGDLATHNQIVRQTLDSALTTSDVVVLAQASMAQALPQNADFPVAVLTSPQMGIQALAQLMEK